MGRALPLISTFVVVALSAIGTTSAAPYVPRTGEEVVEILPLRLGASTRPTPVERSSATSDKIGGDASEAPNLEEARALSDEFRRVGDARALGHAESIVNRALTNNPADRNAILLKASILQSRHDFAGATALLTNLLQTNTENAQAWLMRASIALAQGDAASAIKSCGQLLRTGDELTLTLCLAGARSVSGQAEKTFETLRATMNRFSDAPPSLQSWGYSLLAEIADRLGRPEEAAQHFARALAADPDDSYVLISYADFLFRRARYEEVVELTKGRDDNDSLLLRQVLAAARGRLPGATELIAKVKDRIEEYRLRGETLHYRDEAMWELYVMDNPTAALKCARVNFETQREPADLLILAQSAVAAKSKKDLDQVSSWKKEHGLEDHRIDDALLRWGAD